jgi:hypothetical protein
LKKSSEKIMPFLGGLWGTSQAQALLDNLVPNATAQEYLDKILSHSGSDTLNKLRPQAQYLGTQLNADAIEEGDKLIVF